MSEKNKVLKKIVQLKFPQDQYLRNKYDKTQIVLHHTVSGDNAKAIARYWASKPNRVATCIIISRDGTPYQLFSSRYWGGHIGCRLQHFADMEISYTNLNKTSIGVELNSWGGLKDIDGQMTTCYGNTIDAVNDGVVELEEPYRGYKFFQGYTDAQVQTLKELLIYWNDVYGIPLDYQENMWEFNKDALSGKPGIWSHTSFRPDKSDLFPDENIIKMLKNLKNKQINLVESKKDNTFVIEDSDKI